MKDLVIEDPGQWVHGRGERLVGLDAMRGVAAVLVAMLHLGAGFGGLWTHGRQELAVDLFFLLSGYVLADAYGLRIGVSLSAGAFLKTRLIRLYPLYVLGPVIGIFYFLMRSKVGVHPLPFFPELIDTAAGFFGLPSPATYGSRFDVLYPTNLAAWSLFWEALVNIAFVLLILKGRFRTMAAIIILSALGLIAATIRQGEVTGGGLWTTFGWGFPRVGFSFFLGVMMFRWRRRAPRIGTLGTIILLAVTAAALAINPGDFTPLYDLGCVLLLFPTLVWLGAGVRLAHPFAWWADFAGRVSYPLYVIHMPLSGIVNAALTRKAPYLITKFWLGPAFLLILILVAYALDQFYDAPARRLLVNAWIKPSSARQPPAQI